MTSAATTAAEPGAGSALPGAPAATEPAATASPAAAGLVEVLSRILAGVVVCTTLAFTINFFLSFAWDGPGVPALLSHAGWSGFAPLRSPLDGAQILRGWVQVAVYAVPVLLVVLWVVSGRDRPLQAEADAYSAFAAFIVRAAFWSVFLIGLADALLSFLRVEEFLPVFVGDDMTVQLGLSKFRGQYVHLPLMGLSCIVALFTRSLSVVWLALLIVLAEFQIVITRFIFSYEQAFMGDLVRFWYASLFLLASAYSLVDEGHVRVDVFYARFSERRKAWTNGLGSMLLGVPLCWIILTMGLWTKGSSLASPLLNFEISQSGFGMYVKYLMAGLLVVFALSMAAQFTAYFLESVAVLRRPGAGRAATAGAPATPATTAAPAPSHP